MRAIFLGICTAICLSAAPVLAATVSATTSFSVQTTDWSPSIRRDPTSPDRSILFGGEIFEADRIYNDPSTSPLFNVPTFDTGSVPFDWIHISHDLTMLVETTAPSGSSTGFSVTLGLGGPLITRATYGREDFIAPSGTVRSAGVVALSSTQFGRFQSGSYGGSFRVEGGAGSYRIFDQPYATIGSYYPDFNFLELSRLDGTLFGSITVTAGFGGEAEPLLARSFVGAAPGLLSVALPAPSPVPLPASGLLLGGLLLVGSGMARRRRG